MSNTDYNDDLDEDLDNIPFYDIDPEDEDLEMTFTMNNWDTECILLMPSLGVVAFVSIMLDSDKENK